MKYDITILGAGVSGLTCAHLLTSKGYKVCLLEARARIGGRILTAPHSEALPHPPELGAEFIHGAPANLLRLFKETDTAFVDVNDSHLFVKGRKLVEKADFWEQMEKLTKKLNPRRKPDRAVQEFIDQHGAKVSRDTLELFKAYVEGFQAADLQLMGERSLAVNEQTEEKALGGVELFRPIEGYTRLVNKSFGSDPEVQKSLSLNSVVQKIDWSNQYVQVTYSKNRAPKEVHSRLVVCTLPLGVLQTNDGAGCVQWLPELPELKHALRTLHVGHVQRITFKFKDRFWESRSAKPVSFLHAGPQHYFPTWWTHSPMRTPYLIAWQGGPKAVELQKWPAEKRVQAALSTLMKLTGRTKSFLQAQFLESHAHDWSADPFSRGAYSYTGVQKDRALSKIRMPLHDKIIFAGEATALGTAQGTIHGAIDSGERAAKQAIRLLV